MTIRAKYAEQEYEIATFATMDEQKKKEALEANNFLRDRAIAQAREALEISRQETEGSQQKGFGKGFDERNLFFMRQFYLSYPKLNALRSELSWTHYRILMRVEKPEARSFYEIECIKNNWSSNTVTLDDVFVPIVTLWFLKNP